MLNSLEQDLLPRMLDATPLPLVQQSPLTFARGLSETAGRAVYLKREDTQMTHSFKLRGAMEKLRSMSTAGRHRGVVAASAGNHAQGVAVAARRFGCQATIVMPETTPQIKVDAVRHYGASVVLYGQRFHEAYAYAIQLSNQKQARFVHPYDDPDVVVGQAGVGREILAQLSESPEAIFVPVGGGGLLAGVATVVRALSPRTKIIAVEPEDAASLQQALHAQRPVDLLDVGGFVDGASVRRIGALGFAASQWIDSVWTVSNDEVCNAIARCYEDTRAILEPAGALSIAGLQKWARANPSYGTNHPGTLVAIASGANMDFATLGQIAVSQRKTEKVKLRIPVGIGL